MQALETILSPDDELPPCDRRIEALADYWRRVRPSRDALPGRRHVDPVDLPPALLQWLWMANVARAPLRFRYRLIGTAHVMAEGVDHTGMWLDEAHPRFDASPAHRQFEAVAEQGRLAFYRGPPTYVISKDFIRIERLILPLAQDGRTVDLLLGITILGPKEPKV